MRTALPTGHALAPIRCKPGALDDVGCPHIRVRTLRMSGQPELVASPNSSTGCALGNSRTDETFPDHSRATERACRYSFLTSSANKLIINYRTIAHGAVSTGNTRPGFQPHKGRIGGRKWVTLASGAGVTEDGEMNNMLPLRGSKSFSLNILRVSSLKSRF